MKKFLFSGMLGAATLLAACPNQTPLADGSVPVCDDAECPHVPLVFDDQALAEIDPATLMTVPRACREPVRVQVLRVLDGDTISVRGLEAAPGHDAGADATDAGVPISTVRLIGVNSPEIAHGADERNECYGQYAKLFSTQLTNHSVWLTFDEGCTDQFGRWLAYVHVGPSPDGMWQRYLLRGGYARTLSIPPNEAFRQQFEADEAFATERQIGLYGACPAPQ